MPNASTTGPSRGMRGARCIGCRTRLTCCVCDVMPSFVPPSPFHFVVDPEEERRTTNTGWMARTATGAAWNVGRATGVPSDGLVLFPGSTRVLSPLDRGRTIVVVDGTWRRAKTHVRSAPLINLTFVSLPSEPPSRYRLRDGRQAGRLCTLEAVAFALGALGEPDQQDALLALLDTFVERILTLRGGRGPMLAQPMLAQPVLAQPSITQPTIAPPVFPQGARELAQPLAQGPLARPEPHPDPVELDSP